MYHYLSQSITSKSAALPTQNISGALSGSYSKKRYYVTSNCTIASGVDVDFAAGSVIEFDGDYKFSIIGQIQLNGTASERITVKPRDTNPNNRWRGFLLCTDTDAFTFSNGENNTVNKFNYVDFYNAEKLTQTTGNYHVTRGAAIFAYLYESIEITNCGFYNCKGYDYGGTVYLHVETGGSTTFSGNSFSDCSAQNDSAGAWVFTHGTFTASGGAYSNNTSGWATGNAFGFTVNTGTDLFTSTSGDHYSETGMIVRFAATANAPAPCVGGTKYYFIKISATTWKVASSLANAYAGTAIDLTAAPSGSAVCKLQEDYAWFDATVTVSA